LQAVAAQVRQYLHDHPQTALPDLAYTLQIGREAMDFRLAIVARSLHEATLALEAFTQEKSVSRSDDQAIFRGEIGDYQKIRTLIEDPSTLSSVDSALARRDLKSLARYWTQGLPIRWRALWQPGSARIIDLPAYPFLRNRFGIVATRGGQRMSAAQRTNGTNGTKLHGDASSESVSAKIHGYLREAFAQILKIPAADINPAKDMQQYGADSLVIAHLSRGLAAEFGVRLAARELLGHRSIDAWTEHVALKLESRSAKESKAQVGGNGNGRPGKAEPAKDVVEYALEQFKAGELDLKTIETLIDRGELV
jgi:acyl transferase domain-containing protein